MWGLRRAGRRAAAAEEGETVKDTMFDFFAHILNIVWGTDEDSAPEPIDASTAAILE
jgi:hypothetical protein